MKQISKDYEDEIESLRGDAFFKRKFHVLEEEHTELQTKFDELTGTHNDASKAHTEELEVIKAEHVAAVNALTQKEEEHQQALDALQANHAMELESAKSGASADQASHLEALEALKASHAKQIEITKAESNATLTAELEARAST